MKHLLEIVKKINEFFPNNWENEIKTLKDSKKEILSKTDSFPNYLCGDRFRNISSTFIRFILDNKDNESPEFTYIINQFISHNTDRQTVIDTPNKNRADYEKSKFCSLSKVLRTVPEWEENTLNYVRALLYNFTKYGSCFTFDEQSGSQILSQYFKAQDFEISLRKFISQKKDIVEPFEAFETFRNLQNSKIILHENEITFDTDIDYFKSETGAEAKSNSKVGLYENKSICDADIEYFKNIVFQQVKPDTKDKIVCESDINHYYKDSVFHKVENNDYSRNELFLRNQNQYNIIQKQKNKIMELESKLDDSKFKLDRACSKHKLVSNYFSTAQKVYSDKCDTLIQKVTELEHSVAFYKSKLVELDATIIDQECEIMKRDYQINKSKGFTVWDCTTDELVKYENIEYMKPKRDALCESKPNMFYIENKISYEIYETVTTISESFLFKTENKTNEKRYVILK